MKNVVISAPSTKMVTIKPMVALMPYLRIVCLILSTSPAKGAIESSMFSIMPVRYTIMSLMKEFELL